MELKTDRDADRLTAAVIGRVDSSNAAAFAEAFNQAVADDDKQVIMDCGELSYISSAGLRAVLMIAKDLSSRKAKFALCSLSGSIREVFLISGFDKIIDIHEDQAGARQAMQN